MSTDALQAGGPIDVLIADDHALVREGLRLILSGHDDIVVVAEASDAPETLDALARHTPDVLLLDLNLGAQSGLALLPRIREEHESTAVVILTMQNEPRTAQHALEAGAAGYVLKESVGDEVARAIRAVAAGGTYLQPELGAALVRQRREADYEPLTRREREVLALIGVGYTNAQVADELQISVRTAESHRARIQFKLGIAGRAELIRYAREHGLARD